MQHKLEMAIWRSSESVNANWLPDVKGQSIGVSNFYFVHIYVHITYKLKNISSVVGFLKLTVEMRANLCVDRVLPEFNPFSTISCIKKALCGRTQHQDQYPIATFQNCMWSLKFSILLLFYSDPLVKTT